MSRKQFYTASQPQTFEQNNQNPKKHKFSNFVGYNQNNNNTSSPIHNSNINMNTNTNSTNHPNKNLNNNPSLDKNIERRNKNISIDDKQFIQVQQVVQNHQRISNNPKINQLNKYSKKQSQQHVPTQYMGHNSYNTNLSSENKKPKNHISINKNVQTERLIQKCAICETKTEQCCSLCRKVFYCSAQHQQVDWHMKHKFQCDGRISNIPQKHNIDKSPANNLNPNFTSNGTNKFIFYSNNLSQMNSKNNQSYQRQLDYQLIQKFLDLLERRLVLRSKIIHQVSKINQRTPLIVRQSLVKQTQQLLQLSTRITYQEYKPSYSKKITQQDIIEYSSNQWGSQILISQTGISLQYYADLVLMAKMYHLCGMTKQARDSIISIGRLLQDPEQKNIFLSVDNSIKNHGHVSNVSNSADPKTGPLFNSTNTVSSALPFKHQQNNANNIQSISSTKNLILSSIIQLSELYNIDKTSQSTYKIFVKKIQIQEGIWQQIYAYFNMGVWYLTKTYYDKSIKSLMYALELLDSHKKGIPQSSIFKADCLFNIAIGYSAMKDFPIAIQNMQDCYRIRMNSIGKNSIQCSYCLYKLAKWYKQAAKWNQCLQYLDQCHRVRKLYQNQASFSVQLEQIKVLIAQVYQIIKKQKQKVKEKLDPRTEQYFSQLLTKQQDQQQRQYSRQNIQMQLLDKATVASRLFKDDKQYVKFKVIATQQFSNTLSSEQMGLLIDLFNLTDQKMEKTEAIRILIESPFVSSLNPEQRDIFFKQNQVDKIKEK